MNAGLQASFLRSPPCGDFKEEGINFVRAFAGAFIFAMPLLYTLEMWTIGVTIEIWKIQVLLVLTFLLNVIINYYSGFKEVPDWRGAFEQALEVMAVGIVGAAVILLVLDRISPGDPIKSMLGMIVIQAVPLSIGASVANSIFHLQDRGETGEEGSGFLNDVGATVVGGVLVCIGIAPTDEGTMLASDLDYIHLTAIVLLSLLLSYGIVFASGFDVGNGPGPFQRPVTETLLSYLVSLIVSGTVLYLLDAIDSGTPPQLALAMIVVLTLPATIGGAAGRLVI